MIKIFVDGSCSNNGFKENFGGFGIVVTINDKIVKTYGGKKANTTNNEMELEAIYQAIRFSKILNKSNKKEIIIYSDSAYCVNTINIWMYNWASNGWIKKTDRKPPENLELIKRIYNILQFERFIKIEKVKGHDGETFNEMADLIAKEQTKLGQEEFLKNQFTREKK